MSFTPGSSPLVRRIRLRGISINKGESDAGITIDIELTPSKSPMARATVQYISDIVTLGEMKDMDPESVLPNQHNTHTINFDGFPGVYVGGGVAWPFDHGFPVN